jgi:hypothetical protein
LIKERRQDKKGGMPQNSKDAPSLRTEKKVEFYEFLSGFVNPLIELDRGRIAFTATAAASGTRGQFAEIAFADPFAEHTSQRIRFDAEMAGHIGQSHSMLLF